MKSKVLHVIAVLGVLFLIPSFCTAVQELSSDLNPSISFNEKDNNYLVVYQNVVSTDPVLHDIYGRIVSNEGIDVVAEFQIATTAHDERNPVAAYDSVNNRFMVVWATDSVNGGFAEHIYGRSIGPDGSLLGAGAIKMDNIANDTVGMDNPAIAFDSFNERFLVAWEDNRTAGDFDIYGQIIDKNGALVNANFSIDDDGGPLDQSNPAIAYNSTDQNYLVVWQDWRNEDWNIYGQRVGADGSLIAVNFEISNIAGNDQLNPSVAYDSVNNRYLVIWDDTRNVSLDIYGQIVNADGSLYNNAGAIDGPIIDAGGDGFQNDNFVISNALNQAAPSVAFDSVNRMFLVTWSGADIYGQLVKADGSLYKTAAAQNFVIANTLDSQMSPSVAFNSNYADFLVAFQDNNAAPYSISNSRVGSAVFLPRTGQSICYDAAGKPVSCLATGQDGAIQAGVGWPNPRFEITYCDVSGPCASQAGDCDYDSASDIVTDKLTGLMWPRNGYYIGTNFWTNSIGDANTFSLCGYAGWRLPNVNELESLTNTGQVSAVQWLSDQGLSISSGNYWSSTSVSGSADTNAWYVDIGSGYSHYTSKGASYRVLPVHDSGQAGKISLPKTGQTTMKSGRDDGDLEVGVAESGDRFTNNGDLTVTDNLTGLMWTRSANAPAIRSCATGAKLWQDALGYIACINDGGYQGYSDWRLPNRKELRSLIDFENNSPALPSVYSDVFIDVQSNNYWTSTTYSYLSDEAWFVDMISGSLRDSSKGSGFFVWPVRGGAMEQWGDADVSVNVAAVNSAFAESDVIYTIGITNGGPDTAKSVFLVDTLPAGATFVSVATSQGVCDYNAVDGKVYCGLGDMPAGGAPVNVLITAQLTVLGANSNNVTATLLNTDLNNANNSATNGTTANSPDVTLTITPSADGTVTSTDGGNIDCGPGHVTCSHNYLHDTTVSFTAAPGPGYVFAGFGGDCEGGSNITVDYDKTCTALFNIQTFSVDIYKTGSTGTGRVKSSEGAPFIDCGTVCNSASYDYDINSSVVLTAQADAGSTFTGWSGACAAFGTGACTLSVDASKAVMATFISAKTIGGVPGEGNLHVTALDDGSIGVYRFIDGEWQNQIFDWASKGSRLLVNGVGYSLSNYDGSFDLTGIAPSLVSNTRVSDTHISTSWTADGIGFLQDLTYQPGAAYFGLKWTINNGSANSLSDLRFFHGEDTYFYGDDDGAGFWDEPNNTVGVQKHIGAELRRMYFQAITEPYAYESKQYSTVRSDVNDGALTNTLDTSEWTDNGYALEWRKDTLSAGETWTIFAYEKFADVPVGVVSITAPTLTECNSGSTCSLIFTVTNTTITEKTVRLISGLDVAESGWVVNIQLADPDNVTIQAGASTQVTLTVTLPPGASSETIGSVSLYATVSGGIVASDSAAVKAVQLLHTVNLSASSGGSISPSTPQSVNHGLTTSVTVTPNSGYSVTMGGTCGGSLSGNAYITNPVTADCTVSATFELNTYALTVSKSGAGSGTVTGAGTYGHGSSVEVTASADTGSIFTGWSGDCSGAASPAAVIMDKVKTCTATFAINSYVLTVSKAGTGSGTVTGSGSYSPGSSASVIASADANSAFTGWGGDCTDKSNPATLIMDGAKTCIANFVFSYYSLAINKTGDGTITLNPPGMSCTDTAGGDCYKYNKGQKVTLIASPGKGYIFKGWSSCSGTRPCQVTLDADKTVDASFEAVVPKISISSGGIDLVPGADNYLEFDKVRVGRLKTKTLKIKNSGMGNLIMSALVDGDDAKMFSRKMGSKVTIRPGKSYNLRVTFKPRSADEKSAELVINSNDPDMPSFKIDLGGEGFVKKK